jgi:hypothetical protein
MTTANSAGDADAKEPIPRNVDRAALLVAEMSRRYAFAEM